MVNIKKFQSQADKDSIKALTDFIDYAKNELTLYEDQGGFDADSWSFHHNNRKHAMVFSKFSSENNPYKYTLMEEPFLTFAKAYIRHRQSEKQVSSIASKMVVLRTLHDALVDINDVADILDLDGVTQTEVVNLLNKRYPNSAKLFRYGGELVRLYDFLIKKGITPTLPEWKNVWKRQKARAEQTDPESINWQSERCPSQHQMIALADCFARAETKRDKYWSSVLALLMFAPGRAGELNYLTVDSLHEEEGRLGVRWYGQKGFEFTVKWVPQSLEKTIRIAFGRLIEIGQPARDAAKFAYESPGKFYRHYGCITDDEHSETEPLDALQFAHAMSFTPATIKRIQAKAQNYNNQAAWNVIGAHQSKWIQELRRNGNPSYEDLSIYVQQKYQTKDWPYMPKTKRPIWEVLLLVRENEFHAEFEPKAFSWVMPSVNQLNDQLSQRPMKNPLPTIFQRFELKDEDGGEIQLTSHQLRVWLSTNAERGGMDSWKLAQWAGRARIDDNRHYDLRTKDEKDEQVKSLLNLTKRPCAIESVKLNLPVAYEDLGVNRLGTAEVTEYGFCVHDYAMTPCQKVGECMSCSDHVCVKGLPVKLENIKRLEKQVESQFQKAKKAAGEAIFGADRWATHYGWKLAHIRTQISILEDDNVTDGTIVRIPKDHDPSPIERTMQQKGLIKNVSLKKEPNSLIHLEKLEVLEDA